MAKASTVRSGGVTVDLEEFAGLARDLRRLDKEAALAVTRKLRMAGMVIAADAKVRAAEVSSTIPGSIKVRISGFMVSVTSKVNPVHPVASLFEFGGKGKGGGSAWRHPVFGDKAVWVSQLTHPYLLPALKDNEETAELMVWEALDEAIDLSLDT